jgi:2-methylcitrate dehydratase PrpD
MHALMHSVRATVDPAIESRMRGPSRQPGARVIVHHKDGGSVSQERQIPHGQRRKTYRNHFYRRPPDRPVSEHE